MRLAILADIHGNLPAFEAALRDAAQQRVDQIVIAGDIINGSPDSKACWDLAVSLGCPILRGNHERYAAHYGTPQASQDWYTERFAPLRWTVEQLPEADRRKMGELPVSLRLPDALDLLMVHASERSDADTVTPYLPEERLRELFPQAAERTIVRAHNHVGQVRLWSRGVIVSSGSVGLALDGNPTAQYLLLERSDGGWRVEHRSAPYNHHAAINRFYETCYLKATGPMGRLFFRELVTASQQIVPFLRLYAQWQQAGELPLEQAVERFLTAY